MKRLFITVLVLLCAVSLGTLVVVSVGSAAEVYTADDANGLDSDQSISAYETDGIATGDVEGLNMTATIADDRREVGIDAYTPGVMHTYIRVEYNEEVERTVRIYIPKEYMTPRLAEDVQAENADVVAMYEPVAGGDYMAVTIQFHGETDATFATNDAFGTYLKASGRAYDTVENATGLEIPRLGADGHAQWQYPPDGALSGENATHHLPTNPEKEDPMAMTIQYDNKPSQEDTAWMPVPACEKSVDPVCVTERDGEPVLFNANSDAPPIRYKHEKDYKSETKGALEHLKDEWSGLVDKLGGLAGGAS